MGGGLDGSPVVAGGNGYRIHTVHHSFVVGGGPIGIHGGQIGREDDAVTNLLAGEAFTFQVFDRDPDAGALRRPDP